MPEEFFPPDLPEDAVLFVEAYQRLVVDRPLALGFGVLHHGRIPFLAIERYAARIGISDVDEFVRFDRIIGALDAPEVARLNDKANRKP